MRKSLMSLTSVSSPEILLTPVEYRDDTGADPWSIQMDNVIVVQRHPCGSRLSITTMKDGSFELGCLTANGHDILLAFLQSSVSPERFCIAPVESFQDHLQSVSSVASCLDFDTFQDRHVQNRANAETWNERLSRRFGRIVHNMAELSGTFCDATCCVDQREAPPPRRTAAALEREPSAPRVSPEKIWKMPSGLSVESEPDHSMVHDRSRAVVI